MSAGKGTRSNVPDCARQRQEPSGCACNVLPRGTKGWVGETAIRREQGPSRSSEGLAGHVSGQHGCRSRQPAGGCGCAFCCGSPGPRRV
eukprot:1599716-Pyramimonas_sp.AAC.1